MVHAIESRVIAVNGPLVTAEVVRDQEVTMNEVAYVVWNGTPLKSEVIRIRGRLVDLQVFESTTGLKVGDQVSFTRELLSVTLGPGILGKIYDGLQNPLNMLENSQGFFLKRGQYVGSLVSTKKWDFTPSASLGEHVKAGYYLGYVPEGIFQHHIIVPVSYAGVGEIVEIAGQGSYTINEPIAVIRNEDGENFSVTMEQKWPVKMPIKTYKERLLPNRPLLTQCRLIDVFFPSQREERLAYPGLLGQARRFCSKSFPGMRKQMLSLLLPVAKGLARL